MVFPRHRFSERRELSGYGFGIIRLLGFINYDYDFNRLIAVRYPSFTANNISYTYGAPGSPNNTAGRITKVVSHTTSTSQGNLQDLEERQYGKLGEVVYEKKTVVTFTDPLHPSVFETRYAFDTFGRLLTLIYPDGEVLTNTYDSGGNLTAAKGEKNGYRYDYLKRLNYDKFEQRVLVDAGNGVKTAYSYNAQTRRLNNLTAGRSNGTLFQNLQYSYDNVGNILNLRNTVDVPPASSYGGPTNQIFDIREGASAVCAEALAFCCAVAPVERIERPSCRTRSTAIKCAADKGLRSELAQRSGYGDEKSRSSGCRHDG